MSYPCAFGPYGLLSRHNLQVWALTLISSSFYSCLFVYSQRSIATLFSKNTTHIYKPCHAINTDGESMAKLLPILALALVILSSEACANSIILNTTLHAYLSTYIPNSTLQSASFYNMTLGKHTYAIMQLSSGANRFIVTNTTNHYSVMLNAANISAVLSHFLLAKYYPNQSTLNYLNTSMRSYQNHSASPINDCRVETGVDRFNCTIANECFSCRTIPICGTVITSLGGPGNSYSYAFINGIMNFSSQYSQLNASYISYFSTLSSLSVSNVASSIQALSSAVSTISSISTAMPQNPIFPSPPGTSYSSCGSYVLYWFSSGACWWAYELYTVQNLSIGAVTRRLNERQIPTAEGKQAMGAFDGLGDVAQSRLYREGLLWKDAGRAASAHNAAAAIARRRRDAQQRQS